MRESVPDIDSVEWAWPVFRSDVFQLVAWGFQLARNEIQKKLLEDIIDPADIKLEVAITGLIRKGIREKLDEELPARFSCYSAHNEDPVDDQDLLGNERPRVDILIESGGSRPRIRYRIEAKRCARKAYNSKYTISWYAEGINSFVSGYYAQDSPEGGLLGLMQSDDAIYWTNELAAKLKEDNTLISLTELLDVDITSDLQNMSYSQHKRADNSVITLYHAFLDCITK